MIEGAILAGGKSLRMGRDKATMSWENGLFVENTISAMKSVFPRVMLISSNPEHAFFEGITRYSDLELGNGPLGGIQTALHYSKKPFVFCCACDMPFLNSEVITLLVNECLGWDVVIPEIGRKLHPLCGVYSKNCIPQIKAQIGLGQLKISKLYESVKVKILPEAFFNKMDIKGISFTNINTPNEFVDAKRYSENMKNRDIT